MSIGLTVTGMAAAVWHMGHWIAFVLFAAVILSAGLLTIAIAHALPRQSAEEKSLKQRYREHRLNSVNRQRG